MRQHSGRWSAKDAQAFEAWLAENETHAQAYARVKALWDGLDRFKSEDFPAREAALTRLRGRQPPRLARALPLLAAGLAALGVLLVSDVIPWLRSSESLYRTAKGEQQTVTLADGSQIDLNTDTELSVRITPEMRSVRLTHGEALFNVVRDAGRPFEVVGGKGRIIDLGTQFDVRQTPGQISVAVIEGRVHIVVGEGAATLLGAGEQVSYTQAGKFSAIAKTDVEALTAWRRGKVLFQRAALSDALAEMSRYHAVEFIISDPALRSRQISGTFSTGDLALFLRTLEATLPVKTEVLEAHTILVKPQPRS